MKRLILPITLIFASTIHVSSQNCNTWLATPSQGSIVNIGNLSIPGTTITVEALFNRTTPYSNGLLWAGDLVSKHSGPNDCNYLLRPNTAEITTSAGYFITPDPCALIKLNKTYHVALVYDGASLKFYRDGFLLSQVPATGTLHQNNLSTIIGWYSPQFWNTQFIGYINEVRIWNVARTQAQLQANMTTPLPNPTTQPGLLAYYTFDNLVNKQGNATYNGTLGGSASINQTNPNCTLVRDSCNVVIIPHASTIVNTYTPVTGIDVCGNKIQVEDATTFAAGDTVLMIQMKGAEIDSTNTVAFGTVLNTRNAGNYEMNIVKAKSGNTIELKHNFLRQYSIPAGRVQLIRVPYFQNYTVADTLTCLPWDGKKGGVLVLNVAGTTTMNEDINVSGKGFRGGSSRNSNSLTLTCNNTGYSYPSSSIAAADKGEAVYEPGTSIAYGRGANANGGGGGIGHNSGGGGGANGGSGGTGGYQLEACGNAPFDNRGLGGRTLTYNNAANKIFLGGGGGSGHTDNTNGIDMNGGNGGGIAIIITNSLVSNGHHIYSNGANGQLCDNSINNCHDGNGGGGAGGSVLLKTNFISNPLPIETRGGKGADLVIYDPGNGAGRIGPGGGGGGGITWVSQSSLPANINTNNSGGANGVILGDNNNAWGAAAGLAGQDLFNLQLPVANVIHIPNIDSVRMNVFSNSCRSYNFQGLAYTNTNPVQSWFWDFGDHSSATTQNPSHVYSSAGNFTVKLVVTDINGCADSISTNVSSSGINADFSYTQDICNLRSLELYGIGNFGAATTAWLFGDGTGTAGVISPFHTYANEGTYPIQFIISTGSCTDTITKIVPVISLADDIILTHDTTICEGTSRQLFTKPALSFCWSPVTYLDDPGSPNPVTSTPTNITYHFTAAMEGANLISNGDFSAGNTGFTSGYNHANPNITEGQYFIGNNPQSWNAGLSSCRDHTGGNGNMLLVNGSPVADVVVWSQTVPVTPNTNYAFSTWIQALFAANPAQLSFSINGQQFGNPITASLPTCTWSQFYNTWNSGNSTVAQIAIVNKNTIVQGNDFALDDISFAPVMIKKDSVVIVVDHPAVNAGNDTIVCNGNTVQLSATGAAGYQWQPANGLNNPSISNPVATVTGPINYIITGISVAGCTAKDTVSINTKPSPLIYTLPDTGYCKGGNLQLVATGGNTYTWQPAAGLSNPSVSNPVTNTDTSITYVVSSTALNGCVGNDTITVSVYPLPVVSTLRDTAVCTGSSLQLTASGAASYSWLPVTGLSNASISNPVATTTSSVQYIVKGLSASGCSAFDTTNLQVLSLPVIRAGNDTTVCLGSKVLLNATGAAQYSWLPVNGLSAAGVANPLAGPLVNTTYTVTGTDAAGCSNKDSLTVFVQPIPLVTVTPDSSVCGNTSVQLHAAGGTSYHWSPPAAVNNAAIADPIATVSSSTRFYVTVTGNNNCSATDSVLLIVKPIPVFTVSANDSTCGVKPVQLLAGGGDQYQWIPAAAVTNATIANPVATVTNTTQFSVIVTGSTCNISDTLTTTIKVLPVPLLRVSKSNDIDCRFPGAQLSATGATRYLWLPADDLLNNDQPVVTASPKISTLYTVTATDDVTGCTARDTITVVVDKAIAKKLFIPNAFSPESANSQNQRWKPFYYGSYVSYTLMLYNRFGELIFSSRDPQTAWDGTYKGKKQEPGAYVYILNINTGCREETTRGNVLLVR